MSRMDDPAQQGQTGSMQASGEEGGAAGVTGQLKEKAQQVGEHLRDLGSRAGEQVQQLRESAGQYYDQGRQMAHDYYEQGRAKAHEYQENIESYVREQPLKSVLIAAGIGCLIGFLWRRS